MAFIQVYFNDALQGEVALRPDPSDPVSVGRDSDNDITIDNAGVSGLHAIIWQERNRYVIADAASKNGLLINCERFQRKELEVGDTVKLPKYTLKFALESAGCGALQTREPSTPSDSAIPQKSTIEIDVAALGEHLTRRKAQAHASLRVSAPNGTPHHYVLDKVNVRIGKARQCDIRTGAWLGPAVCATITRRSDGYYVKAENGASVLLNGMHVREPTRMSHGDRLAVRRCELTFHDAAPRTQSAA